MYGKFVPLEPPKEKGAVAPYWGEPAPAADGVMGDFGGAVALHKHARGAIHQVGSAVAAEHRAVRHGRRPAHWTVDLDSRAGNLVGAEESDAVDDGSGRDEKGGALCGGLRVLHDRFAYLVKAWPAVSRSSRPGHAVVTPHERHGHVQCERGFSECSLAYMDFVAA